MLGDAVEVTDDYGIWWSYVPHFIGAPGYVYAYSFGYLFSLAIYRRYLDGGRVARRAVPGPPACRRLRAARRARLAPRLRHRRSRLLAGGLDAIGVLVDEAERLAAELDA